VRYGADRLACRRALPRERFSPLIQSGQLRKIGDAAPPSATRRPVSLVKSWGKPLWPLSATDGSMLSRNCRARAMPLAAERLSPPHLPLSRRMPRRFRHARKKPGRYRGLTLERASAARSGYRRQTIFGGDRAIPNRVSGREARIPRSVVRGDAEALRHHRGLFRQRPRHRCRRASRVARALSTPHHQPVKPRKE
jgi:hypothetical protein